MRRMLSDVISAFTSNGVPIAHVRFRDTVPAPYAEAHLNGTSNLYADNRNSRTICDYDVVLHVSDRDLALEAKIEDLLDACGVTWRKTSGLREDVDLVTVTYNMEVFER